MGPSEARLRLEAQFAEHAAAVRAYTARRIPTALVDDVASDGFVVAGMPAAIGDGHVKWFVGFAPGRRAGGDRGGSQRSTRLRLRRHRGGADRGQGDQGAPAHIPLNPARDKSAKLALLDRIWRLAPAERNADDKSKMAQPDLA